VYFCSLVLCVLPAVVLAAMAVLYLLCFTRGVTLGLSGLSAYESEYEPCLTFLGVCVVFVPLFFAVFEAIVGDEDLLAASPVVAALPEGWLAAACCWPLGVVLPEELPGDVFCAPLCGAAAWVATGLVTALCTAALVSGFDTAASADAEGVPVWSFPVAAVSVAAGE